MIASILRIYYAGMYHLFNNQKRMKYSHYYIHLTDETDEDLSKLLSAASI